MLRHQRSIVANAWWGGWGGGRGEGGRRGGSGGRGGGGDDGVVVGGGGTQIKHIAHICVFTIQSNFLHGFSTQTHHKSNKWKVSMGRLDGLWLTLFVNLSFSTDGQNMILKIGGNPSLSVSVCLSVCLSTCVFAASVCVEQWLCTV